MSDEYATVYCITNKTTDKQYVGVTKEYNKRKKSHYRDLKEDKHNNDFLQKDYNKFGKESFSFEIIENNIKLKNRFKREKYWIKKLKTFNNGYNQTTGGIRGFRYSEEFKDKRRGENNGMYGKTHTEEVKQLLSEIHSGKTISEEQKQIISENSSGINNPKAKVTKKQGLEIYNLYHNSDLEQKEVGELYNISKVTVGRITRSNHWTTEHLTQ